MNEIRTDRLVCAITGDTAVVEFRSAQVAEYGEASRIAPELKQIADSCDFSVMVVNCSALQFGTSTLLSGLVDARTNLAESNRELRVCCLNPVLRDMFRAARLGNVIAVYDNVRDAIQGR